MLINIVFVLALAASLLVFLYPRWRRKWVLGRAFPQAWLEVVKRKLPFYPQLSSDEQQQLLDLIRLFIDSKKYFGCNGLRINDEIRVTIAAQACLLLLNRHTDIYPTLRYILVYPQGFRASHEQRNPDGTMSAAHRELLGESWQNGKVILSWDDVEHGAADFSDGHNVVLHEFSHQLDSEDGATNGAPPMRSNSLKTWAVIFAREFAALNEAAAHHHHAVMDFYGATNPAEFFAVATETFFEKPQQLEQRHPELYAQLCHYYKVNPDLWQAKK